MIIETKFECMKNKAGYSFSLIPCLIISKDNDLRYKAIDVVFCWLFFYYKIELIETKC